MLEVKRREAFRDTRLIRLMSRFTLYVSRIPQHVSRFSAVFSRLQTSHCYAKKACLLNEVSERKNAACAKCYCRVSTDSDCGLLVVSLRPFGSASSSNSES